MISDFRHLKNAELRNREWKGGCQGLESRQEGRHWSNDTHSVIR